MRQLLATRVVVDRLPEAGELLPLEMPHATSGREPVAAELHVAAAIEDRADVRLVRRLVLGKAGVAVDAEHRFSRIDGPEASIEFGDLRGDIADQLLELLAQQVIRRLVPGEPGPVVVLLESGKEFDERLDVHATGAAHPPM